MSRMILIFGQSGAGKTYSLKNLDPAETFIIDADKKGALCWRGAKKSYKLGQNYFCVNSLEVIRDSIVKAGTDEKHAHIKNLVIDGISNALSTYEATYRAHYQPKNNFEPYQMLKEKVTEILDVAKNQRENLNIIFVGNVKLADPYQPNSADRLLVPGNYLKENQPESHFNYVFYAKVRDGNHLFETQPNRSTAKTPEGCFPEIIPNDIAAAIKTIEEYENAEV